MMIETHEEEAVDAFEQLLQRVRPQLRRAILARYGSSLVDDVEAETLRWAWEHQDRLRGVTNPGGYLYRVAQTSARKLRRTPVAFPAVPPVLAHTVEPGLPAALARLSEHQRVAVVLVHGYGWPQTDAARFLDISESTLRNHLRRGLRHLRNELGVDRED